MKEVKTMKTIIGVIFLVFVVIIGFTAIEKDKAIFYHQLNQSSTSEETSLVLEKITIKISGCVEKPGTYEVNVGSTLDELIAKAGGLTLQADSDCFNEDLVLEKSMSLYIAKETDEEKISLNDATLEELDSLKGIGKSIAERIIEYREEIGEFTYLEQIMEVNGIGQSIFTAIKNRICL